MAWTELALPFSESPMLDVEAGALALEIEPLGVGELPRLELKDAHGRGDDDTAPPLVTNEGGVVQVRFEASAFGWPPWGRGRHILCRLFVPPHLRARVRCGAGQIRAQSLAACDLDLATGAGQIRLRDVHGRLTLGAQAGEIRGERIGGTLQVDASLGSVRLEIDSLDPGTHRFHSSMGSLRLELRIDAHTSMGSTRNRYPTNADADTLLSLETDLGSVRVDPGGSRADGVWDDWRGRWGAEREPAAWPARKAAATTAPTPPPADAQASDEELKRILSMIEQGKINAAQASDLIHALQGR